MTKLEWDENVQRYRQLEQDRITANGETLAVIDEELSAIEYLLEASGHPDEVQ